MSLMHWRRILVAHVEFFQPLKDDDDGLRGFSRHAGRLCVVLRASSFMSLSFPVASREGHRGLGEPRRGGADTGPWPPFGTTHSYDRVSPHISVAIRTDTAGHGSPKTISVSAVMVERYGGVKFTSS
jgi:hypothetical protein